MKSFPSTANESEAMYGSGKAAQYSQTFDIERIKALNLNTSLPVIKEQLKQNNINASNFQRYPTMTRLLYNNNAVDSSSSGNNDDVGSSFYDKMVFYENPLSFPANAIALAKDYDWVYKYKVNSIISTSKDKDGKAQHIVSHTTVVPSMFNPMYGVSAMGLIRNTPLLNDFEPSEYDRNIDDCSIRTLCALSKNPNSPIGAHRYKYADFMYCKDLGRVSNNHLITLRKFAHPIPDHIGRGTTPKYLTDDGTWQWKIEGDVGRLVTWFGTDDNKLEDIAKFSYHASWKELNAEIQELETKADDPNTGILGMISNTKGALYNEGVNAGTIGNHSILTWLGSQISPRVRVTQGIGSNNTVLLSNYDKNKVYTPKDTIQSNHIYEGKLEFSHEFTLVFSYELRAYDNINPRSAFLDLIGNILEVTYRRGRFWGGSRHIIGPAQDTSLFDKVHGFIDGTIDKLPGFIGAITSNGASLKTVLGTISSSCQEIIGKAWEGAKDAFNSGGASIANKLGEFFSKMSKEAGDANVMDAVKGMIKNSLGRPQLYAWHSLVSGDDVGLWHVTVGNPKNPILSIGNLILTNAEIQQSGPLGVDDFPTQLKVIVTLKHPRPRDITDIGRMYTGGTNALYHTFAYHNIEDFYSDKPATQTNNNTANDKKAELIPAKEAFTGVAVTNSTVNTVEGMQKLANTAGGILNSDNKGSNLFIPTTSNGLPDPSIYTKTDIDMMRKNTWNDTVFTMMMQETA